MDLAAPRVPGAGKLRREVARAKTELSRRASIYEKVGLLIIAANAQTTAGIRLTQPPVFLSCRDATAGEIGAAVRAALAGFRAEIPHPTDFRGVDKPFLEAAGFRSWLALTADAKYTSVAQTAEGFRFWITRNGGPKNGFQPFGAPDHELHAAASDEELGRALLGALDACE